MGSGEWVGRLIKGLKREMLEAYVQTYGMEYKEETPLCHVLKPPESIHQGRSNKELSRQKDFTSWH